MVNVRDYTVIINGESITPVERRTFLGIVLEYVTSDNKYVLYPMNKYEQDHAEDANIISHVKSEVHYEFM